MKTARMVSGGLGLILLLAGVTLLVSRLNQHTVFILVRHAERADDSANSNLSERGLERAQSLVSLSEHFGIKAIYSTNFCRTVQTAQPLARHLSQTVHLQVIPSSQGLSQCMPSIEVQHVDLPDRVDNDNTLIDLVLERFQGGAVLIAGHSNTVPRMVETLGKGEFEPVAIEHDEYEDIFVISVPSLFGKTTLEHTTYERFFN